MKQKYKFKLLFITFSIFLLLSMVQITVPSNAVNENENVGMKVYQNQPPPPCDPNTQNCQPPPPLFNTTPGTELVYNITDAQNGTSDQINVTEYDPFMQQDIQIGAFVAGDHFVFRFEHELINDSQNMPNTPPDVIGFFGAIQGQGFDHDFRFNTTFKETNQSLDASEGPPLTYFVIPSDVNFSSSKLEFEAMNYTVVDSGGLFAVDYTNSTFNLNATWNKTSGILVSYYYHTGDPTNVSANMTLGFDLLLEFNPAKYMPAFGYDEPILFYKLDHILFGQNHTMPLEHPVDPNDPNYDPNMPKSMDHGFFEEGQIAMVELNVWQGDQFRPPSYEGVMRTMTGESYIRNPFGGPDDQPPCDPNNPNDPNCQPPPPSSKTQQNNPPPPPPPQGEDKGPQLMFLFPTSTNDGWFTDFGLLFSSQHRGNSLTFNSTHFELFMQDPMNPDMNITMTYERSTGLLLNYASHLGMPDPQNMNNFIPSEVSFSLYSAYEMKLVLPTWGVTQGSQYKYLISSLLSEGNHRTTAQEGYFEEGQEVNIRFDELVFDLHNFTNRQIRVFATTQTVTGRNHELMSFGGNESSWPFLMPILPQDSFGRIWEVLEDQFGGFFGGHVTNTASTFSIELVDLNLGHGMNNGFDTKVTVFASWNKTNGLLKDYNATISDMNGVVISRLSLSFLGESSGDVYVPPTSSSSEPGTTDNQTTTPTSTGGLTTSPGFGIEIVALAGSLVAIPTLSRRRKK